MLGVAKIFCKKSGISHIAAKEVAMKRCFFRLMLLFRIFNSPRTEILSFRIFLASLLLALPCPSLSVAESITFSGSPIAGAPPVMITAFVNQSTGDVYPAGQTDRYVFSLFDTGSTMVVVDPSNNNALLLSNGNTTTVRINGLSAIQDGTLYAPIYAIPPYGPPQAQVGGVGISLGSDKTLIGGPVTNQVSAVIDYTKTITKGPYGPPINASQSGPDITFYQASNSAGYTPAVQVALGRAYQTFTDSNGVSHGQTYLMYNVKFLEGGNSVASPASGDLSATSTKFLYDSGTTVTLISSSVATALGYSPGFTPEFTFTVKGSLLPGFKLDSLTMTGLNGDTCTVLNVPVLVGGTNYYDAIIGSNVFNQTKILFDGPGNTLGIGARGEGIKAPSDLRIE